MSGCAQQGLEVADPSGVDATVEPIAQAGGGAKADDVGAYGLDAGDVVGDEGASQRGQETVLAALLDELAQLPVVQVGEQVVALFDGCIEEAPSGACLGSDGGKVQGRKGVHPVGVGVGRGDDLGLGRDLTDGPADASGASGGRRRRGGVPEGRP